MKQVILLLMTIFSITGVFGQKEVENDTTKLKLGNKTIIIIEKNEKDNGKIVDKKIEKEIEIEEEDEDIIVKPEKKVKKYKAGKYSRWAGLNLGFNTFVEGDNFDVLSGGSENWEINPWKSTTWNLNIFEISGSLVKRHLLITTGLGFEFQNYRFKKNIDLEYNDRGDLIPVKNQIIDYDKDKLFASYVQVPLLLEINTSSKPKKGFYLSTGLIGGYKMASKWTKKYKHNGQKVEVETKDDFNLNPFQLQGTVRLGFNRVTVFTDVALLPVFKENSLSTGKDLHNITFGVQLVGF
ncbi:MAG TPA: hypothetical protein ENK91_00330 [Bacteroidetes bacterium]|nr:hypothetical protein [Bacteroidota bacterium]